MQQFGAATIRSRKQHESDTYCWTCHREKPELSCSTCVRSFHISSLCSHAKRVSEIDKTKWRCTECLDIENGAEQLKDKQISAGKLKEVLNYMYNKMIELEKKHIEPFMTVEYPRGAVVNTMDLSTIRKKIEIGAYSCCEDFQSDIKWILHNTKVHHLADYDIARSAKFLLDFVKEKVYCFNMCPDCYATNDEGEDEDSEERFTMLCSRPHLILWAKQRTYPYWPAKLLRYNGDNNTFDVRYFGGAHLRAILPVKDCLLYSRQNPSTSIGRLKGSLNEAVKEAECYIKKLIAKYGQFNLAEPLSFIHGNNLERHLYDTIPGAWKELGNAIVPPPIKKLASATVSRRMSMPAKRSRRVYSTLEPSAVEVIASGRVITRRMSTIIDVQNEPTKAAKPIESEEKKPTKTAKSTESTKKARPRPYRRQSVQCERSVIMTVSSALTRDTKNNDPIASTSRLPPISPTKSAQKRKLSQNGDASLPNFSRETELSTSTIISGENASLNLSDDNGSVFKVPLIPKRRKLSSNVLKDKTIVKAQSTFNTHTMNELSTPNPTRKTIQNTQVTDPSSTVRKIQLTPEMSNLCKTVIEKSAQKMTESVRLSLTETLFDFLNTSKPGEQIQLLQEQLENQRKTFNELIQNLRAQNQNLKVNLKKYKDKCNSVNKMEGQNVIETNMKVALINDELEKSKVEINELNGRMNTMSTKNAFMTTTVAKLQAANNDLSNNLKITEATNARLLNVNANLMNTNAKLNDIVNILKAEKTAMAEKMKALELNYSIAKQKTFEQCAKKVTETKQQQWCATCGIPGGQYFCSADCKLYFR
ncbi:protein kinase C-binding protein 1-like [Contarinia nasturtii]|uniref:protein kinase C-binding protein 1-like n=1 Tax=Contarinia nasturtii TaxID=265458 RepID=UPI0012D4AF5A|nr:protein kinase C-binding protein 1-like [Contarinia nasturtii]